MISIHVQISDIEELAFALHCSKRLNPMLEARLCREDKNKRQTTTGSAMKANTLPARPNRLYELVELSRLTKKNDVNGFLNATIFFDSNLTRTLEALPFCTHKFQVIDFFFLHSFLLFFSMKCFYLPCFSLSLKVVLCDCGFFFKAFRCFASKPFFPSSLISLFFSFKTTLSRRMLAYDIF
jgi:hypothetical protein